MVDKTKNPVAKYARKFNKAVVMTDRKKAMKKGDRKHKGAYEDAQQTDTANRTNSAAKKPINYTKPDGTRGVKMVPHDRDVQNEDLRKWFGKGKEGDWVRVGTDGEIKGDCARDEGEGKPKCMPRSKAHSMSTKDRASSARRKRRADPTVDRPGTGNKPIMVNTDKKESVQEKNVPTNPKLWAKFKSQAKSKFDVYPSAYANGWAAKQYKAAGGGWKSMKEEKALRGEEVEQVDEVSSKKLDSYLKKSRVDKVKQYAKLTGKALTKDVGGPEVKKQLHKMNRRELGNLRAKERLNREEVEHVSEGVEQVDEVNAPSTVKHKGKTYYSTGKRGKHAKTGAWHSEYSSDMDGGDERVWYNTKTKKITRESVANESTAAYAKTQSNIRRKNKNAAITSSDKAKLGKLSALMKKQKREEVEQVDEASQVLIKKMQQLAGGPDKMPRGAEFRALKKRAQDELKKDKEAKKAAPVQKTTSKTSKGKTQTGSADPADRNLIMQLRKAQDVDGKMDIQVSPAGKSIRLPKAQIDSLLKKHDSLGKPVDKRKFKIMLTKALRAKAK